MILLKEFPFQVYTLFLHLGVKHPISWQRRWNNWKYIFSNNWNVLLGICIGQSLHKHTLHLMQKLLQWWWLTSSLWIIYLCIINLENLKLAKRITRVRFLTCDCSNFFLGHVFYFHDKTWSSMTLSYQCYTSKQFCFIWSPKNYTLSTGCKESQFLQPAIRASCS